MLISVQVKAFGVLSKFITNTPVPSLSKYLISTLTGSMNMIKQALNLVYATTADSTIIVPMFEMYQVIA